MSIFLVIENITIAGNLANELVITKTNKHTNNEVMKRKLTSLLLLIY